MRKKLDIEGVREVACITNLNCMSQVKAYLRDLDQMKQLIQIIGFVRSAKSFNQWPKVIDTASEINFGWLGKHIRLALVANELSGGNFRENHDDSGNSKRN